MFKLSSAFISAALSISGIALFDGISNNFASAQSCDASAWADKDDFGSNQGFCSGTPSVYGIKAFKMGFCTSNPFTSAGVAADYSSCTITFEDAAGVDTSFTAGGSNTLPAGGSSIPPAGSYSYAVIEIDKTFDIAAEMGPFQDGTTYYSTSSWTSSGSPGKTTGSAETFPAQMTSFDPNNSCQAISDPVNQAAATLRGYLIDSKLSTNCGQCRYPELFRGIKNCRSGSTKYAHHNQ